MYPRIGRELLVAQNIHERPLGSAMFHLTSAPDIRGLYIGARFTWVGRATVMDQVRVSLSPETLSVFVLLHDCGVRAMFRVWYSQY